MKFKSVSRRLLATAMTGCLLMTGLIGCGANGNTPSESVNDAETSKTVESSQAENTAEDMNEEFDPKTITEGVTITIAVEDVLSIEDYETNNMTLAIEEALGVNLEFMTFPSADFDNKMNVMVMSGDELPDIIFTLNSSLANSWAAEGALLDLSEYYSNPDYAKNINIAIEAEGIDIVKQLTDADGHVYGLPFFCPSVGGQWNKLWFYEPWLDAVGKDVPTTAQEFYEACKLICESDPNGNGKADELALSGFGSVSDIIGGAWFRFLMSSYVYSYYSDFRYEEDGVVGLAYASDEWKEGLKYIKQFFDDGLLSAEMFTQSWDQQNALWYADDQIVCGINWFSTESYADKKRASEFVVISALTGPDGQYNPMYEPDMAALSAVITADCENPEAAFLVCDYMFSEEMGISNRSGQQGVDWDYWENANVGDKSNYEPAYPGNDISIIRYDDNAFFVSGEPQNRAYLQRGPLYIPSKISRGIAALNTFNNEDEEYLYQVYDKQKKANMEIYEIGGTQEAVAYLPMTVEENEKIADPLANLTNYMNEATTKFLLGELDIDNDWNDYIAELEKIGYKDVIAVYQAAYDRVN